jgi:hypothetical protein
MCWSVRSDLPRGTLGLVVVHDDVGVIGRAGRGEVELLSGDVAGAESPLDFGGGSESRQIPDPGAIQYLLERGGHEDVSRCRVELTSGRRAALTRKRQTSQGPWQVKRQSAGIARGR